MANPETSTPAVFFPPFTIVCDKESPREGCATGHDTNNMLLTVITPKGTQRCICKRRQLRDVFEKIRELGVVIEF